MPPTRARHYSSSLPKPVEAVVAIRMADGSIVGFQGPVQDTEFKIEWGFEDPLSHSGEMTRSRARTTINWNPGVQRGFVSGMEDVEWHEELDEEPIEIPASDRPKELEA